MNTRPRVLRPRPRPPRRLNLILLFLLLVFLLPALIRLGADWLWFQSLAYDRVFTTQVVARTLLGLAVGAAAFAFVIFMILLVFTVFYIRRTGSLKGAYE